VPLVLIQIHELLITCHNKKTTENNKYDELIIIMVKSAIDKLTQLRSDTIMDSYNNAVLSHHEEDKYINTWIKRVLQHTT